jgi:tryptophanyl-tRNA synthetase
VLRRSTREVTAAFIASGIDPKKHIVFNQSQVSGHAELAWVFNCVARMGWLSRMTQFKEKAGKDRENASVGLFAYPSLMAADILLYRATHVPVGEDQKQHLELCRDIAQKFNNDFGDSIRALRRRVLSAHRATDPGAGDARHEPARRHQEDVEVGRLRLLAHQPDRRCRHDRAEDPQGED